MQLYDLTLITEGVKNTDSAIKKIEELGGKINEQTDLGLIRLAYPINKKTEASFTIVVVEIEPEKVSEVNRKLSLDQNIWRHLIIKTNLLEITARKKAQGSEQNYDPKKEPRRETPKPTLTSDVPESQVVKAKDETKTEAGKIIKKSEKTKKGSIKSKSDKTLDEKLAEILKA